jgi:hypothetical protein
MFRSLQGTVALIALCAAAPALAADYADFSEMRPAFSQDWGTDEDTLQFEAGVRYWYSVGQQKHEVGAFSETMNTKTSSGEVFARINDRATRSYVEATGGYGISHGGNYSTNGGASLDLPAARLGYVGADFGWLPFGSDTANFGFVTGYQYTNDSPDSGRANFTVAESASDISYSPVTGDFFLPYDSEINNFDIHALKLGLAGKVDVGGFDISGEAAATPYAWVSGTYGGFVAPGQSATQVQASAAEINGFGYGVSGKLMFGVHPTENLTIRVGGRASYLQGQYDATWDEASIVPPQPQGGSYTAPLLSKQTYIIDNNPFSMLRYGGLLEVSGRF